MAKKQKKTSVDFTNAAEDAKNLLLATYTLKQIVSGGVIAFKRLTPAQREQVIAEANGATIPDFEIYPTITEFVTFWEELLKIAEKTNTKVTMPPGIKDFLDLKKRHKN